MRIHHLLSAAVVWTLAGCGDDGKTPGNEGNPSGDPGGETAGQSETGGGTGNNPTTGIAGETSGGGTSGGVGGESGSSFIVMDDVPTGNIECDVFAQDCPDGQKCMPWANDGGNSWNAAKCTPVNAMPKQTGDTCQAEGDGLSGVDDCDIGLICWFLDAENKGTCADMCDGTPEAATCPDPTQVCDISNDGVIIICLNTCNPLVQDCPEGQICFFDGASDFICDFDASGDEGQYLDGCAYVNDCDYGLYCEDQAVVPGCMTPTGCCTPYCSLAEPMCPEGAMCEPWYEGGSAPPGQEDIGACIIPP
jgi:hypothetical protein